MFRQLPKLLAIAAALLFVAGCATHDRTAYKYPLGWKTHPASEAELPPPGAPGTPEATLAPSIAPITPGAPAPLPQQ